MAAAATEASRSPPPNSEYTTSGSVCVLPSILPANMIVAPNSPSARDQLMTAPAARPALASGTMTQRKTARSLAPSTRAASSMSRSTAAIPARAERTKNGTATKVWARITASVVNGMTIPKTSSASPTRPRRPNTKSSARPATDGGRTIGRSTIVSTMDDPRNGRRART